MAPEGLAAGQLARAARAIQSLAPDVVHITGVHLWNVLLIRFLRRTGVPVIHTLHDLDPHIGVRFAPLIRLWNRLTIDSADHLLVHGQVYARRLVAAGYPASRLTSTPLLHLFLSYEAMAGLDQVEVCYGQWGLFFGRLESYKGIPQLMAAERLLPGSPVNVNLVLAGTGSVAAQIPLSATVELRDRRIGDAEAVDLFRRCGFLVLPYLAATQSALVAAAYYFAKPVIVANSGALAEYVHDGVTGWIVPAADVNALAEAMREALAEPQRLQRMGLAGKVWYDRQRVAEGMILADMYDGMTERRRAL
jgi:glycosyltransferase involved in cell wall biosynthesis